MCLVLVWKTGFAARLLALVLSQYRADGEDKVIPNPTSNYEIHNIFALVTAKVLYSASAEEREMVGCFFELQETNELPQKMQ